MRLWRWQGKNVVRVVWTVAALGLGAQCLAESPVDFTRVGVPQPSGDSVYTTIKFQNNSGSLFDENLVAADWLDVYSYGEPPTGAAQGWLLTCSTAGLPNMWHVSPYASVPPAWIAPSDFKDLPFSFSIPPGYSVEDVVWTTIESYGDFQTQVMIPDEDGWSGPVGVRGDLDGDGNTDLDDYALFEECLTGPGDTQELEGACRLADYDGDSDVDLADYAGLQVQLPGFAAAE